MATLTIRPNTTRPEKLTVWLEAKEEYIAVMSAKGDDLRTECLFMANGESVALQSGHFHWEETP